MQGGCLVSDHDPKEPLSIFHDQPVHDPPDGDDVRAVSVLKIMGGVEKLHWPLA